MRTIRLSPNAYSFYRLSAALGISKLYFVSAVNHQYSVHPVFQRVTRHDFFEKIQIYCFLILCGILPLLVTRDISAWKECVIDLLSIHDSGENIFNVYSEVNIVQLTTFKQTEHERDILCSLMTSSMRKRPL